MITVRKLAIGMSALSAISALASTAYAQNGATQSATASGSATIIQPISVASRSNLDFGTIVKPSNGTSTITVNPDNSRGVSGGDAALVGSATAASFSVVGEGGSAYSVSVPSFTMTRAGGTETLVVTTNNNNTLANLPGSIGTAGTVTLGVGGNFTLTSSTLSGNYTGNVVVTAQYN